jgi:hypothetical protein
MQAYLRGARTVTICCTERRIFVTSLWMVKRTYEFVPSVARHKSSNWLLSTLFARWFCSRLKKSACNDATSRDAVLAASPSSDPCKSLLRYACLYMPGIEHETRTKVLVPCRTQTPCARLDTSHRRSGGCGDNATVPCCCGLVSERWFFQYLCGRVRWSPLCCCGVVPLVVLLCGTVVGYCFLGLSPGLSTCALCCNTLLARACLLCGMPDSLLYRVALPTNGIVSSCEHP